MTTPMPVAQLTACRAFVDRLAARAALSTPPDTDREDDMRLHPRTLPVQQARYELDRLVWEWMQRHDVTYVEAVRCLLEVMQGITKYQLRAERHPDDPERKADEA